MAHTQYLPSYTIGEDAYDSVPDIVGSAKAVIIGGKTALSVGARPLELACDGSPTKILGTLWYGPETSYESVAVLADNDMVKQADVLFAMGGGKALDTVKALSKAVDKPVYTFPTIASNCAAVSAIAIMYNEDGTYRDHCRLGHPCAHCFVNSRIIAEAPRQYFWAGIGDTLAKYYEVSFSMRGDQPSFEPVLGVHIAAMCADPIVDYGAEALADADAHRITPVFELVAATILVGTGLVSGLVGGLYNTALAHAIYYGLCEDPSLEENHLHGEVVAYGLLVQLVMDGQQELVRDCLPFYRKLELPTRLSDLDIAYDGEHFGRCLVAIETNSEIEHVPYKITGQMIVDAMHELDDMQS